MVSWTIPLASIVEKIQMMIILKTIPLTHIVEKIQIAMFSQTQLTVHSSFTYWLSKTTNNYFRNNKKKTCWHDNDKKFFRNIIICDLFYQWYCLILPSSSKLRHDFPHVISIKKVASLMYPSLSCKVSFLALTFYSFFSLKKKVTLGYFIRRIQVFG